MSRVLEDVSQGRTEIISIGVNPAKKDVSQRQEYVEKKQVKIQSSCYIERKETKGTHLHKDSRNKSF